MFSLTQQNMNPENQFHQQQLETEKRKNNRESIVITICCSIISLYGIGSLICWPLWQQFYTWQYVLVDSACALAGPATLPLFLLLQQESREQVTQQDVDMRRQSSRRRLMQQAQGHLPWIFGWKGRVFQISLAILLLLMTLSLILVSFPLSWRSAFALPFALGFLYLSFTLFYYAFYLSPRMAKALPVLSAQELSHRLSLGENTRGPSETQ